MELEKLNAKIIRYVFHNEDNSYSIVKVSTSNDVEVTIVGYLPILSEDVSFEFLGTWINHATFGKQFKVESYTKSENQTEEGLVSYLSSSFFVGIGPVSARRIVDKLGIDAINIILNDPNVLQQFGFTNVRIKKLETQLIENQMNEHILVQLYSYNIAGKTAMKILNHYRGLAMQKLEENPYQLITDIEGIGFIKADEIAKKLGIENDDPRRIKAAVLYAMQNYSFQRGDTYLFVDELKRYANNMLKFEFKIEPFLKELIETNDIVLEDDRYYLLSTYFAEVEVANEFKRLISNNEESDNIDYLNSLLEVVQIQKNIEYTDLQKEAILTSLNNKVSVITGGPGTGKTTIIDGILEIYSAYNKIKLSRSDIEEIIGLMAPTGRAAKRMQEVLNLPAKTIHRQLGYGYDGKFIYDESKQMPQQLIIIDESSMVDIFLAKLLLKAIKTDAKVIIVGDVDQLPSVGPGSVLKDIIESKTIPVVRLNEIHRQAKNSNIITLANAVNKQELRPDLLVSGNDLFLRNEYNDQIIQTMISQIRGALDQNYDMIEDIQVLIPTYKGEIGIDAINQILQKEFNDTTKPFIEFGLNKYYELDKVIQLVNDPKNGVMNGDIGYVKRISQTKDNKDYLIINFDGNEVIYEKGDLDAISLAYAMSIHKSQGSEYKIVILPLVRQYMHMLKKELLYTAITRAKDFLIILGDMDLLVYAANNLSEQRKTSLKYRLEN